MPELYAITLSPGTHLQIHGTVPAEADRTSLNLQYGPYTHDEPAEEDTVFMHLDVRHLSGTVVRNHFENGGWGEEECSDFPGLQAGEAFLIDVKVTAESLVIQINGVHIGEFKPQVPLQGVTHMLLFHDIIVNSVSLDDQKLVAIN